MYQIVSFLPQRPLFNFPSSRKECNPVIRLRGGGPYPAVLHLYEQIPELESTQMETQSKIVSLTDLHKDATI